MRLAHLLAFVGLVALGAAPPAAQPDPPMPAAVGPQCPGAELTTTFGRWFSPNIELGAAAPKAGRVVPTIANFSLTSVRLMIEAPAGGDWQLILRDPDLRVLAVIAGTDFNGATAASPQRRWTGRLPVPQLSAELVGAGPATAVRFRAGLALPTDSAGLNLFSTKGQLPDWAELYDRPEATFRRQGESVGMMVTGAQVVGAGNALSKQTWCCSGALLSPDIYITNWHCGGVGGGAGYWTDGEACANTVLDLGWDKDGNRLSEVRRQYSCSKVLHQNRRLDYALLRVRPVIGPGAATGRANPVTVSTTLPTDDQVFVVHHAQCRPKLVSYIGCVIRDRSHPAWTDAGTSQDGPDLTYQCDTEPGASGAPVFDMAGRMIALHHLGYARKLQGGVCTRVDDVNKAVTMKEIVADLKQDAPAIARELGY